MKQFLQVWRWFFRNKIKPGEMALRYAVRRGGIIHGRLCHPLFTPNFSKSGRLVFPRHTLPGFRTPIRALQESSFELATSNKEDGGDSPNWKVKMLYDGECPLCMREVNMLRERNKRFGTIKFVDISSDDYSAAENQDLDYPTAMGRIHAILSDGSVVMDVEAFRRLYEAVGLGWVYAITKYEPIGAIANSVYGFWAKYRLLITGRPALDEVIEAKLKKKEEACHSKDSCKM